MATTNTFTFSPTPGVGDTSTTSFNLTMTGQVHGQTFSGSCLVGGTIVFSAVQEDKYTATCNAVNSANVAGPATTITVNTTVTVPVPLAPVLPQPVIDWVQPVWLQPLPDRFDLALPEKPLFFVTRMA